MLPQVTKACQFGATDMEVAELLGVDRRTLYRWKAEFPEFCLTFQTAKDVADARVERSLYERAIGYRHEDVHVSNYQGDVTITPIEKVHPPDTTAAAFWLKNRKPDEWREKSTVEVTGAVAERMNRADARLAATDADD